MAIAGLVGPLSNSKIHPYERRDGSSSTNMIPAPLVNVSIVVSTAGYQFTIGLDVGIILGVLDGYADGGAVGNPVGGVVVGSELIVGLSVGYLVGLVEGVSVMASLAAHPVKVKQEWPGVVHSASLEVEQGWVQSLLASTHEEPQ